LRPGPTEVRFWVFVRQSEIIHKTGLEEMSNDLLEADFGTTSSESA